MSAIEVTEFPWPEGGATRAIGSVAGRQSCSVMLVGAADGDPRTLVFQREVPATFGLDWKVMPYRGSENGQVVGGVARWCRLEVQVEREQVKDADEQLIRPGMELVIARAHASCWAADAPFRKSNRKGPHERADPLGEPASGREEVIERLEALDYDPWETGDFLTAGISLPPDPWSDEGRNYSRGKWLLGACHDVDDCCELLRSSRSIQKLLQMTEEGGLRFWPTRTKKEIPDDYKRLHDETKADAGWLMEVSLRQALAGPDDDSAELVGKPVATLVERIFKNHLYNRNRSLQDDVREQRELYQRCRECYNSYVRRRGRGRRAGGRDE